MKVCLIQPDTHFPYENHQHVRLFLKVAKALKPDYFVNLGDSIDFWQLSKFSKDPLRKNMIHDDLDDFKKHLYEMDKALGDNCQKIFLGGNHEARIEHYIRERCPEITKLVTSVRSYCGFDDLGWSYIPYGKIYKLGTVHYIHGDLIGINSGIAMLRKYGVNVVHGHDHRGSVRWFQNLEKNIFCMSCGHLSDQSQQEYLKYGIADWASGFGIIYYSDNFQQAYPTFVPIFGNSCIVNGQEFRV